MQHSQTECCYALNLIDVFMRDEYIAPLLTVQIFKEQTIRLRES